MHQMPDLVVAGRTKAHDAASVAVRLPQVRVDPSIRVEWRDHDVAVARAAGRMALFAGELETNLAETRAGVSLLGHGLHAFMLASA